MQLKCITLWQPWASLCVEPWTEDDVETTLKDIETRGRPIAGLETGDRLGIHAGRTYDKEAREILADILRLYPDCERAQAAIEFVDEHGTYLPRGALVGAAGIRGQRWLTYRDVRRALCPCDRRYGYGLMDQDKFEEPIEARGFQGMWRWTPPEEGPAPSDGGRPRRPVQGRLF